VLLDADVLIDSRAEHEDNALLRAATKGCKAMLRVLSVEMTDVGYQCADEWTTLRRVAV
jgi:hypothetical protein